MKDCEEAFNFREKRACMNLSNIVLQSFDSGKSFVDRGIRILFIQTKVIETLKKLSKKAEQYLPTLLLLLLLCVVLTVPVQISLQCIRNVPNSQGLVAVGFDSGEVQCYSGLPGELRVGSGFRVSPGAPVLFLRTLERGGTDDTKMDGESKAVRAQTGFSYDTSFLHFFLELLLGWVPLFGIGNLSYYCVR